MSRYNVSERTGEKWIGYALRDEARSAEAVVYPALGCNCVSFSTTPDGAASGSKPIEVFIPPVELEELTHAPVHGGNPILFPFPNRVRNGEYTFEGKSYSMPQLLATGRDKVGQAIHGLVNDRSWTVDASGADTEGAFISCSIETRSDPYIFSQYPFPCRLTVTYRLRDGILAMEIAATNTGDVDLPMGFGIHPWFPIRLRPGDDLPSGLANMSEDERRSAEVRVPADATWELEKLMPTGKIVPVDTAPDYDLRAFRPLETQFFDTVFTRVIPDPSGWSEGGLRDPVSGVDMYMRADAGFREWVLYAPVDKRVIALEPYTCTTDAVNLQPRGIDAGLITLPPGATWTGEIHFGLRARA